MSNHLPHFADKGGQLLNLTGYPAGNLERMPCQSAYKVQIENCCRQPPQGSRRPGAMVLSGPVLEIVQDIIDAEKKAADTISAARADVAQKMAETERVVAERLAAAREQAAASTKAKIEATRRDAEQMKRESEVDASDERAAFLEQNAGSIEAIVDEIVSFLSTPEYSRG